MAINFKITLHQNPDNLHLRLDGDFDASSACELLNILEKSCPLVSRVFIHTSGLRHIHPFGSTFFQSHFSDLKACKKLLFEFTGNHAQEIAPDRAASH
jgi:hypothetical protein